MLKFGPILLGITLLCNLVAFGAVLSSTVAFGESLLPPCPTNEMALWTDCQGTYTRPDGRKEVGEFRDNKYVGGSLASIVSNTPSLASRSAENGLSLLIPMVLLVVGSAVAALFVMRAKPQTSLALSTPASTHAATQSKLDDTRRALREAAIDFSVPDDKLLELRRAFAELDRKAAKKDLFGLLKFW